MDRMAGWMSEWVGVGETHPATPSADAFNDWRDVSRPRVTSDDLQKRRALEDVVTGSRAVQIVGTRRRAAGLAAEGDGCAGNGSSVATGGGGEGVLRNA